MKEPNAQQSYAFQVEQAYTVPLTGALALLSTSASAQMPAPSISLQGDPKRPLTMEEQERQKKLDGDYKAATKKIPNQKANDPWADVRPPTAPAPKKKQQ
jgi:hypothetical protein